MKKAKNKEEQNLLDELRIVLSSIHSANLSNIKDKEVFIDNKLDKCFDIIFLLSTKEF
jgi:hypothetical protein